MKTQQTPKIYPAKSFRVVPGAKLLQLKDLKAGDVFQYQGSDSTAWNTVLSVDDNQVHYRMGGSPIPSANWRNYGSIYVWVNGVQL